MFKKKKKKSKQYLLIGLGRFGSALARYLETHGAQVLAVDVREDKVREVCQDVTHTLIADAADERVISELGVEHFDAIVCGIGENLEASVMACVLLKEHGAKHLVAKATSDLHGKCLLKLGVDRVIYPERDMAERLAKDFVVDQDLVELLPLTVQYSMFEVKAPASFAGSSLVELDVRAKLGINIVAIRRGEEVVISPRATEVIQPEDLLIVVGERHEAMEKLEKLVAGK